MKISINDTIVKLICIIPLTTLFSKYYIISTCNRILTTGIVLCLIYSVIRNCSKKTLIAVMCTILVYVYSLLQTRWPIKNINELFYLAFWVLLLNDFADHYSNYKFSIIKNNNLLKSIVCIWTIFTFISLFVGSSYDGAAFYSFTGGEHRFASSALQIFAMASLLEKIEKKKLNYIFCVLPVFSIMLTGARTYMIVIAIAAVTLYYKKIKTKLNFYTTIIPIILVCILFVINSSIMTDRSAEIDRLASYYGGDYLRAITSGRSVWWLIDFEHFFDSSILNQFFGNGFHWIRAINLRYYGTGIWAHNDFIMLLGTNGYIGLLLYLQAYLRASFFMQTKCDKNRKIIIVIGFHAMNFINASLNMLYTYFCAALAMLFLLVLYFDDGIGDDEKIDGYYWNEREGIQ